MEERLQKFLANQGICSRRKAEEYILAGKVKVNGQVVTELGTKINPEKDKIKYNDKLVETDVKKVYISSLPTGTTLSLILFKSSITVGLLN